MNEFKLTEGEVHSPAWQKVEKYLRHKLAVKRIENDDGGGHLSEMQTAKLRGRIAELKELLALKPE